MTKCDVIYFKQKALILMFFGSKKSCLTAKVYFKKYTFVLIFFQNSNHLKLKRISDEKQRVTRRGESVKSAHKFSRIL